MARKLNTPKKLIDAYSNGMRGWQYDPRTDDELMAATRNSTFSTGAPRLAGEGAGKRVCLWRYREQYDAGAFAKEAQTTGDCVSHGDRNARDVTRCASMAYRGELGSYYKRGATEPTYGSRDHGGQGMDPAVATRFVQQYGYLFREDYPGVIDLTKYNSDIGNNWGRRGVPQAVLELCKKQNVDEFVRPERISEVFDLLHYGAAGHSGQSLGFKSTADSRGISAAITRGRDAWGHDMGTVGYDATREFYPIDVVFIMNSWGAWNTKPKKWSVELFGPWIPGIIVCDAEVYDRICLGSRSIFFYVDVDNPAPRVLPDFGTGGMFG